MKKLLLLAALLLVAAGAYAQAPKKYGIKCGIVKTVTDASGRKSYPTVWFDDYGAKEKSVVKMQRIQDVLDAAAQVYANFSQKIPTARLNETMLPIIEETPPPAWKGKYVKVKYITQLPTAFPAFAFFCNLPQYIKDPYKHFLENQLRANFPLTGCPVQIYCRQK